MTTVRVVMMKTTRVETTVEALISEIIEDGETGSFRQQAGPADNQADPVTTKNDEGGQGKEQKKEAEGQQDPEPDIETLHAEHWAERRADPRFF